MARGKSCTHTLALNHCTAQKESEKERERESKKKALLIGDYSSFPSSSSL
jgi:hypothetical protein